MEGTTYGYVRISTREQNEARQLAAMREFGVEDERIIVEKLSSLPEAGEGAAAKGCAGDQKH